MRGRIPALEAVRGVAALSVLAYHYWLWHPDVRWLSAFSYGWLGVEVFFALSGFVLFLPYARGDRRLELSSFMAGRLLRIVPAWWVAVIGAGLLTGLSSTWANVGQLVFIQNWWRPADDPVPVGWTLCAEVCFYLMLPIVVFVFGRYRLLRWPLLGFLIVTGWYWVSLWGTQGHLLTPFTPFTYLDHFAWGMVAATMVAGGVRVRGWWAALAFAGLLLVVVPGASLVPHSFPRANMTAALFAVILAWLATSRFRVPRPMVWLGTVSYGVYLWHWAILDTGHVVLGWLPSPIELGLLGGVSVLFGWASWRMWRSPRCGTAPS